jgi:hypothetical protein
MALKKHSILRLPEIYRFSVLIFVYKYKNGLLPTPFHSFFTTNSQVHRYNTRNANLFRMPVAKTKMASLFIKKTGVNIWNHFSTDITHDMKIGAFKKIIIALLVSTY